MKNLKKCETLIDFYFRRHAVFVCLAPIGQRHQLSLLSQSGFRQTSDQFVAGDSRNGRDCHFHRHLLGNEQGNNNGL